MKLSEYKNTAKFLTLLFVFFRDNDIKSSWDEIYNYREILDIILNAEFISCNCIPGIEHYTIDFKMEKKLEIDTSYFFIFGKEKNNEDSSFLLDIGKDDMTSFFAFTWHEEKLPSFMMDFIDQNTKLKKPGIDVDIECDNIDEEVFMDFDEFKMFLDENRERKDVKVVVVD